MKFLIQVFYLFLFCSVTVHAENIVFYETIPVVGKLIIMGVSIGIHTFIIRSHVPLFELLDTDKVPDPPKVPKAQLETLKGTVVGIVFGLLITVLCIVLL